MPLHKAYTNDQCEVTFTFNKAQGAKTVHLVAEFNGWDRESLPMKQQEGGWQVTVTLDAGESYQYRYLIDSSEWENDSEADGYEAHPYGGENSVVHT